MNVNLNLRKMPVWGLLRICHSGTYVYYNAKQGALHARTICFVCACNGTRIDRFNCVIQHTQCGLVCSQVQVTHAAGLTMQIRAQCVIVPPHFRVHVKNLDPDLTKQLYPTHKTTPFHLANSYMISICLNFPAPVAQIAINLNNTRHVGCRQ